MLAAFHWLEYLGLLGAIGSVVVRRLGRIPPRIAWANPPLRAALIAALVGGLGVLAGGHSWWVIAGHAQSAGAQFAAAVHMLSAGIWGGGILALATLRPPDGWRGLEARTLLERFGRVALIAFGITALSGLLRATDQINDVSDLWTTTYGVVLSLKVAGVFVMLGLSILWRRGRQVAGLEAGAVVLVVGATALLAAFPQAA